MRSHLNKKLLIIFAFLLFLLPLTYIHALQGSVGESLLTAGGEAGFIGKKGSVKFADALIGYTNGLVVLMGALYLIVVIYAGYLWMNSRGSDEEVEKARKIIIWSTAGIGTIVIARIIAEFVIITLGTAAGI